MTKLDIDSLTNIHHYECHPQDLDVITPHWFGRGDLENTTNTCAGGRRRSTENISKYLST